MVQIIRKARLPDPAEVIERLRPIAAQVHAIALREPRPVGFPLLFTADLTIIEPAMAFCMSTSCNGQTRRDAQDLRRDPRRLVRDARAERHRAGTTPTRWTWWPTATAWCRSRAPTRVGHTKSPPSITACAACCGFYQWAVRTEWLQASPLAGRSTDFALSRQRPARSQTSRSADDGLFVLRQYEPLPRPLAADQARELLATLQPPYDLMARWQIYTGLRVSELLRLDAKDIAGRRQRPSTTRST